MHVFLSFHSAYSSTYRLHCTIDFLVTSCTWLFQLQLFLPNWCSSSSDIYTQYRGFYLIPIITLHPDQLFVSKLLIIHESCISLESVTFWEESNCIKYVSSNLCSWSIINQNHYRMTTYYYVMFLINYGSGTQIWRNLFNAIRFFPKSYTF